MSEIVNKRRIGVVTTSRADYSHLYWPLRELAANPAVDLGVFALGAHLSPKFGSTIKEIERDGFPIKARIECLLSSDTDTGMAKTIGLAILGLADALTAWRPDLLLLIADRYEMLAPASAPLLPCASPSPTSRAAKSARAPSTTTSATPSPSSPTSTSPPLKPRAAASSPWARSRGACIMPARPRSTTCAAPRCSTAPRLNPVSRSPSRRPRSLPHGIRSPSSQDTNAEADAFFSALAHAPGQLIFVYPNSDAGSHALIERTRALAATRPHTHIFVNLDAVTYWSLLGQVDAIVGNSSTGIMEAASFALPVVNVGMRQQGRERARNIIDSPAETDAIRASIQRALSPAFRESLRGMENPYGNGTAAVTIARVLSTAPLDGLLIKQPAPLPAELQPEKQ